MKKGSKMLNIKNIELNTLKPWKENPRINDKAVTAVVQSIKSFGFNVPIICNQEYIIIAGHTRWKAAKQLGLNSVPVIILSINKEQQEAFAIADNKTSEIADWDYNKLKEILTNLQNKNVNLPSLGYSKTELEALLAKKKEYNWKEFQDRFQYCPINLRLF